MTHRPHALRTALAATLLLAGPWAVSRSHAATLTPGTATYRLSAPGGLAAPDPNASAPQVIAAVVPPNTVVPPNLADGTQGSPLTILGSSAGFDQGQLIVALKDQPAAGGVTPSQLFGLSFFGTGLAKDGHLDFSLNIDKALTTPPELKSMTDGVSIVALPPAADAGPTKATTTSTPAVVVNTTPQPPQVPEPMSVMLWSVAVGGAGLARARAQRRKTFA